MYIMPINRKSYIKPFYRKDKQWSVIQFNLFCIKNVMQDYFQYSPDISIYSFHYINRLLMRFLSRLFLKYFLMLKKEVKTCLIVLICAAKNDNTTSHQSVLLHPHWFQHGSNVDVNTLSISTYAGSHDPTFISHHNM